MPNNINMLSKRKVGYAFHGPRTPPMQEQEETLLDLGCGVVFTDKSPDRYERGGMIASAIEGDVVVMCGEYAIGSGEADAAKAVKALTDAGAFIQIMDGKPKLYSDPDDVKAFAKAALNSSRKMNAAITAKKRVRSGPKAKLDDLTDAQWEYVKWWWARAARQEDVADFCNGPLGCSKVTRVNIAHKIKAEIMAGEEDDV